MFNNQTMTQQLLNMMNQSGMGNNQQQQFINMMSQQIPSPNYMNNNNMQIMYLMNNMNMNGGMNGMNMNNLRGNLNMIDLMNKMNQILQNQNRINEVQGQNQSPSNISSYTPSAPPSAVNRQRRPGDIEIKIDVSTGQSYKIYALPSETVGSIIEEFLNMHNVHIPLKQLGKYKMVITYNANNVMNFLNKTLQEVGINNGGVLRVIDTGDIIGGKK